MRKALSVLAVLLVASCVRAEPPKWLDRVTVRTEHVVKRKGFDLHQGGTGTVVLPDERGFYVLTCRHNFETTDVKGFAQGRITVLLGGKTYPARVVRSDASRDLALLRVDARGGWVGAELAKRDCARGDRVVKLGYPSWRKTYGEGKVLGWHTTTQDGRRRNACDARSSPGDSGEGLFRLKDRKLVGVVRGGTGEFSSFVTLEDVRQFLSKELARK